MTSSVHDDGTSPRACVGGSAGFWDTQATAKAGFEATLSLVVEAFPMACAVLSRSGQLVSANRGAACLVDCLSMPQVAAVIDAAMASAQSTCSPISVRLGDCEGDCERFHVTSLLGANGVDVTLFLITAGTEADREGDADPTPSLQSYDLGPTPIRVLREEAARFKRLSEVDPLTGALNVRTFAALVGQALKEVPRRNGALICLDLNRFKLINDRFGHLIGDKVLIHVADKLTFPAHTGILTARLGGDEFALWMPGVRPRSLQAVIRGLRERVCMPVDLSDQNDRKPDIRIKASIGVACCPDEALNYQSMRQLADQRLYEDKARFGLKGKQPPQRGVPKRKGAVDPAPQSFLPR